MNSEGITIFDKDTEFRGEIETEQLILEGRVTGVVKATGKVLLKKGSYLKGEVFTRQFNMLEGSRYEGNLYVNTEVDDFEKFILENQPKRSTEKMPGSTAGDSYEKEEETLQSIASK